MNFENQRALVAYINERLHFIGNRDYLQTTSWAFISVLFKQDGGIWQIYSDTKNNEMIITVNDGEKTVAEIHYVMLNDTALKTTYMGFRNA